MKRGEDHIAGPRRKEVKVAQLDKEKTILLVSDLRFFHVEEKLLFIQALLIINNIKNYKSPVGILSESIMI